MASWATAPVCAAATTSADAGAVVGGWRLRRTLGHLLGGGLRLGAPAAAPPAVLAVGAAAAPKKKKAKKAKKEKKAKPERKAKKSSKKSSAAGKSSKSKGGGKGKKGKSKKGGKLVGKVPPSVDGATGNPARPWENPGQAERVAEALEWLTAQREKLGLNDGTHRQFDPVAAAKESAKIRKKTGEDPLMAKLKAMGETKAPGEEAPKKGKP